MLENLKQLVKENAQSAILENSEVPNDQNEAAVDAASGSIMDALKGQLASGNLGSLVDIFKGGNFQDNAVVQEASSSFVNKLEGLGVNVESAKNIAGSFIPEIMDKFANKTNDPNDSSFNFSDMMTNISGPDGKFQLSDLTNLISGGAEDGSGVSQGGIVDKLKGFFK
ncbi:MAG TPA: hypothetical protein VK541_07710 [Pedobacter sp.]|uniref:hypothetical protein n=1 Tax=Pedobacter sp. TaxID=1411316 RepID=UPI002B5D878A|nr:hypothetical protein [Pedobacter sp.]HMI02349.1 hypothetical protein [Pedobacter sp.]